MSVQDAFKVLWEELPCSARLVEAGGPGARHRRSRSPTSSPRRPNRATPACRRSSRRSTPASTARAGPRARPAAPTPCRCSRPTARSARSSTPCWWPAPPRATSRRCRGPSRCSTWPRWSGSRSRSEQVRERLEDERRLFRMVLGRARRGVVLIAADTHPDADELTQRSRFVDELGRRAGPPAPEAADDEPVSVARGRRDLAPPARRPRRRGLAPARRARRACARSASTPRRWWFQRDWTDTGRPLHETLRLSYSRLSNLDNCELQHVLGDELGLGRVAGYQAWVGKLVHGMIEDIEQGEARQDQGGDPRRGRPALARRRSSPRRRCRRRTASSSTSACSRTGGSSTARRTRSRTRSPFEFEFDGATIVGVIDRIGPTLERGHAHHRLQDRQRRQRAEGRGEPAARHLLPGGQGVRGPRRRTGRCAQVELAYVKGDWKREHELV